MRLLVAAALLAAASAASCDMSAFLTCARTSASGEAGAPAQFELPSGPFWEQESSGPRDMPPTYIDTACCDQWALMREGCPLQDAFDTLGLGISDGTFDELTQRLIVAYGTNCPHSVAPFSQCQVAAETARACSAAFDNYGNPLATHAGADLAQCCHDIHRMNDTCINIGVWVDETGMNTPPSTDFVREYGSQYVSLSSAAAAANHALLEGGVCQFMGFPDPACGYLRSAVDMCVAGTLPATTDTNMEWGGTPCCWLADLTREVCGGEPDWTMLDSPTAELYHQCFDRRVKKCRHETIQDSAGNPVLWVQDPMPVAGTDPTGWYASPCASSMYPHTARDSFTYNHVAYCEIDMANIEIPHLMPRFECDLEPQP